MERRDHITLCLGDWTTDELGEILPLLEKLTADYTRHECFTEPWEESPGSELEEALENV